MWFDTMTAFYRLWLSDSSVLRLHVALTIIRSELSDDNIMDISQRIHQKLAILLHVFNSSNSSSSPRTCCITNPQWMNKWIDEWLGDLGVFGWLFPCPELNRGRFEDVLGDRHSRNAQQHSKINACLYACVCVCTSMYVTSVRRKEILTNKLVCKQINSCMQCCTLRGHSHLSLYLS